jgi:hypothetical protein
MPASLSGTSSIQKDFMTDHVQLSFSPDELGVLIDALEADFEDYTEASQEAAAEGSADQATDLKDAALQVQAVLQKVRGAHNDG